MVLDHNDEGWYDEAEEVDEAVDLEGTVFPLRLGRNLQGAQYCTACSVSATELGRHRALHAALWSRPHTISLCRCFSFEWKRTCCNSGNTLSFEWKRTCLNSVSTLDLFMSFFTIVFSA